MIIDSDAIRKLKIVGAMVPVACVCASLYYDNASICDVIPIYKELKLQLDNPIASLLEHEARKL